MKIVSGIIAVALVAWLLSVKASKPVKVAEQTESKERITAVPEARAILPSAQKPSPSEKATEPFFEKFQRLGGKVVRSKAEKAEWLALLSDSTLQATAAAQINSAPKTTGTREIEERMQAVSFLANAILEGENPGRAQAKERVVGILKEAIPQTLAPELKRTWAADKVELFRALSVADSQEAADLERALKDHPNKKLFTFAKGYYATPKSN